MSRNCLSRVGSVVVVALALVIAGFGGGSPVHAQQATDTPASATPPTTRPFLLHLPGIGGYRSPDRNLIRGFRRAGLNADMVIYDWTEGDSGIHALQAMDRNLREADRIAKLLTRRARQYPGDPLMLTSHSGGGAMAIWTLERLPADVHVKDVMLLAPALSPDYDLTKALKHVDGHLYSFNSIEDQLVLGMGCRVFGTMDGKLTDAAGRVGFIRPATGDPKEYQKLVQRPYEASWSNLGNFGDHIGPMSMAFAAVVLEPLFNLAPVQANMASALSYNNRTLLIFTTPPTTQPLSAAVNLPSNARVNQ